MARPRNKQGEKTTLLRLLLAQSLGSKDGCIDANRIFAATRISWSFCIMFDLLTCSYSDTILHGESFPVDGAVRWNAGLCGTRELDSENDEVASEERAFFGFTLGCSDFVERGELPLGQKNELFDLTGQNLLLYKWLTRFPLIMPRESSSYYFDFFGKSRRYFIIQK